MTYQEIRGALEVITYAALDAIGIECFFDNVAHEQPDASATYAEIAISFETSKRDNVGCCGTNDVGGTIGVNIFTPANTGSRGGEDAALAVFEAWAKSTTVRLRNFDGPRGISGDEGARHQLHRISAAFRGKFLD